MTVSAMESRRHSPECMCCHCEATDTGYFAQRALLAGDWRASGQLSQNVASLLLAERGTSSAMPRSGKGGRPPRAALLFTSACLAVAALVAFEHFAVRIAHVRR